MRRINLTCALLLLVSASYARNICVTDSTPKKDTTKFFTAIDIQPQYPGGLHAFNKDIVRNLHYPDVANLIGINGNVYVSFVVEANGDISSVTPIKCLGAGCESEAVKAISMLKPWTPGIQNGRPVRVRYTVPINFNTNKESVSMRELKNSNYGFVFYIKQNYYNIDEAQKLIGKTIKSDQVEIAEPFDNTSKDVKFNMPEKKAVYLIVIKN